MLKKIGSIKKNEQSGSQPFLRRITDSFKEHICAIIDTFYEKLGKIIPLTDLEDQYTDTYSLESIAKSLRDHDSS